MSILKFFNTVYSAKDNSFLLSSGVTVFQSLDYFNNFFSLLADKIKKNYKENIVFVDLSQAIIDQLFINFETSFLGQSLIYWCKNLSFLDAKNQKKFLTYLQEYSGPHYIFIFIDESVPVSGKFNNIFFIEKLLEKESYLALRNFFSEQNAQDFFCDTVFSKTNKLSIESACLLLQYNILCGKNSEFFFKNWFDKIVPSESSLFILSQHFFSQNSTEFLKYWNKLSISYPIEFWVAYWSEQLWQAIIFIYEAKIAGLVQAKKAVNRLPFSFMQKDFKKYNLEELQKAHSALYQLDYNKKNGFSDLWLEFWLMNFLQKRFA